MTGLIPFDHKPGAIIELYSSRLPRTELGVLYRYEIVVHNYEVISTSTYLNIYPIIRKTPRGAWIDIWGQEKFVLDGDGKRFAYTKLEWALHSLKERVRWRMIHARWAVTKAEAAEQEFQDQFGDNNADDHAV